MMKIKYRINGKEVTEQEWENHGVGLDLEGLRQHKGHSCSTYPMESYSAGINPDHIKEQMKHDRLHGVPTAYNPETGDAIFTGPGHRKLYGELHGLWDLNGGYGDPQRGGRN